MRRFVATLSNDDDQLRLVSGADSWAEFAERWPHREGGVASMGAPAAPDAGWAPRARVDAERERKLVRSSIALYGTKYASTCLHRPGLPRGRAVLRVLRDAAQLADARAQESRAHDVKDRLVPRAPKAGAAAVDVGRQQGVGAALADITEEPTLLGRWGGVA